MALEENIKCVLHGSFRHDFDIIKEVYHQFANAGIKVIAPEISEVVGTQDGFVRLKNDSSRGIPESLNYCISQKQPS